MDENKEFFLIEIKFCSKYHYAVWETSESGDFLLKKDGKIHIRSNKLFHGITFHCEETTLYDLDSMSEMLQSQFKDVDSERVLSFWNLTQDAANTINYDFIGNKYKYDDLYNKLFQNTSACDIIREQLASTPVKNEFDLHMEASLYKSKAELEFTNKDREKLCHVIAQAIEMWSEIFGDITKETAKKQLQKKYGYCAGKSYIPLNDIKTKADNFFINRGTIDIYEQQIKDHLRKKFGQVFYLSVNKNAYYPWHKDFLEMSDKIAFDDDRMCETAMFPRDFSFLIYVSHEQTITFAGQIVEDMKKILTPVAHKINKWILC